MPAGTPTEVVLRLNSAFNQALDDPAIRQKLTELGFLPVGGKPQAYSEVVAREIAKWRQVIKDSNIPAPN
jgi:tripartite-type tricarboxylate transporter receptor subunit TctC